ncbi:MAG: hypothetical protein R2823_02665 [Acidimicrobiia bacterium]
MREPVSMPGSILGFGSDRFRIGILAPSGKPEWEHEILFGDIVEIEHRTMREVLRGRLRNGTEFDIRFKTKLSPAKAAGQASAIATALDAIRGMGTAR